MTTTELVKDLREKSKVLCGEGFPITCDLFHEAAERLETLQKQLDEAKNQTGEWIERAMSIPKPMHLYILFADGHIEKYMVSRFSDLSQTKSRFYYFEEPGTETGKGKTFRRDEIDCFELSYCPKLDWEQLITKDTEVKA